MFCVHSCSGVVNIRCFQVLHIQIIIHEIKTKVCVFSCVYVCVYVCVHVLRDTDTQELGHHEKVLHLHLSRLEGCLLLADLSMLEKLLIALTLLPEIVEFH